ncbi:MAG: hypothetical protein ACLPQY_16460 [Streptosporangiaceae bacterium]
MTMQLRQDDPEGDRTVPGVHDVGAGVFRIPLPLPQDGLQAPDADPRAPMLAQLHRAHLDVLVLVGRMSRSEVDGVALYTRS